MLQIMTTQNVSHIHYFNDFRSFFTNFSLGHCTGKWNPTNSLTILWNFAKAETKRKKMHNMQSRVLQTCFRISLENLSSCRHMSPWLNFFTFIYNACSTLKAMTRYFHSFNNTIRWQSKKALDLECSSISTREVKRSNFVISWPNEWMTKQSLTVRHPKIVKIILEGVWTPNHLTNTDKKQIVQEMHYLI